MKVKICGLTNLEDAQAAVTAGADYLGFIFYPPSKRAITPEAAKAIVQILRQADHCPQLVGVFVNETGEKMAQILETCQLDLAQLSGNEVPKLVGDPASPIYGRSYKALRPTSLAEAEADAEWFIPPKRHPAQPSLLLDAPHETLYGGTGETGDWSLAARLAQQQPRLMLAGGLTPDNVETAVSQIRPFAVDVASGVEAFPGKKDHAAIAKFLQNAKKQF